MEMLIGLIFWGGLLWLMLAWMTRGRRPRQDVSGGATKAQPAPPPLAPPRASGALQARTPPVSTAPDEAKRRETEALVDGLVIGHFLSRDHYLRKIDDLEVEADRLRASEGSWFDDGTHADEDQLDDPDDLDYAEFDAMGGFGLEPWADDFSDLDDDG